MNPLWHQFKASDSISMHMLSDEKCVGHLIPYPFTCYQMRSVLKFMMQGVKKFWHGETYARWDSLQYTHHWYYIPLHTTTTYIPLHTTTTYIPLHTTTTYIPLHTDTDTTPVHKNTEINLSHSLLKLSVKVN